MARLANVALMEELLRELPPCGSPICDDPDCSVPPGECHGGCGREATIAKHNEAKRRYVLGTPKKYCKTCKSNTPKGRDALQVIARERFVRGESSRHLAADLGVSDATILRWCGDIERTAPAVVVELSPRQAAKIADVPKETIMAAIKSGRLPARFGTTASKYGKTGPAEHWIILREDLDVFIAMLKPCLAPGCNRLGVTSTGYCGRGHTAAATNNLGPVMEASLEKLAAYEEEHGLWRGEKAASHIKVSESLLAHYERTGLLVPVERRTDLVPGRGGVKLYKVADVKRAKKVLLRGWTAGQGGPLPGTPMSDKRKDIWNGRSSTVVATSRGKRVGRRPLVEEGNADEREILQRFQSGESQRAIAEAMSMTRDHVRGVLKRHSLSA
jgi:hypothetical protein